MNRLRLPEIKIHLVTIRSPTCKDINRLVFIVQHSFYNDTIQQPKSVANNQCVRQCCQGFFVKKERKMYHIRLQRDDNHRLDNRSLSRVSVCDQTVNVELLRMQSHSLYIRNATAVPGQCCQLCCNSNHTAQTKLQVVSISQAHTLKADILGSSTGFCIASAFTRPRPTLGLSYQNF